MESTNKRLSIALLLTNCLILSANSAVAQQNQPPGVTIDAKRSADLVADREQRPQRVTVDVEKVREFDRVSGVCLRPDDSVAPDVSIQLYRKTVARSGKPQVVELVGSAKTENDGTFAFDNIQSEFPTKKFESYFVLVARKDGYSTKFLNSVVWDTDHQKIKLSKRAMVRGVIRNEQGQPVPDAAVSFHNPLKDSLPDVFASKTDQEGRFQINDYPVLNSVAHKLKDGTTRGSMSRPLIVEHPDHGRVALMVERTPNLFMITISRGAKFNGRIVDEANEPVADCRISMQSHNREPHIWFETRSDQDGFFQFTKVAGVRVNLFFRTDDLIGNAIELSGETGSETDLGDLKLIKPIVVSGVVIDDETGEPIKLEENLRYPIGWHGPERPSTSAGISSVQVQADGTFECQFLPGKNFPYIASGYLQRIGKPYKDGIEITEQFNERLEFRVKRKDPNLNGR